MWCRMRFPPVACVKKGKIKGRRNNVHRMARLCHGYQGVDHLSDEYGGLMCTKLTCGMPF